MGDIDGVMGGRFAAGSPIRVDMAPAPWDGRDTRLNADRGHGLPAPGHRIIRRKSARFPLIIGFAAV
jgi:hypothetical protein